MVLLINWLPQVCTKQARTSQEFQKVSSCRLVPHTHEMIQHNLRSWLARLRYARRCNVNFIDNCLLGVPCRRA
jgi:hypothetical protein